MIGVVRNSTECVFAEGGRVARTFLLGVGRHILLRQLCALPDAHLPEIEMVSVHKTVLRLVRGGVLMRMSIDHLMPVGELQPVYQSLLQHGCVNENVNGEYALSAYGRSIPDLPISCEYAEVIIHARGVDFFDTVLAGVAFLDAAAGGSVEVRRTARLSPEYRLCGTRASGGQDDFLRFAHFTMLSRDLSRSLELLGSVLNVYPMVLRRAAEVYEKLRSVFRRVRRDPWSEAIVRAVRASIGGREVCSDANVEALLRRSTPIGDGVCSGVRIAQIFAKVWPEQVGVSMCGGMVYVLGTGTQVLCEAASDERIIPLLFCGDKLMGY